MINSSYKKLHMLPTVLCITKKPAIKFALAISLIITLLSLLIVQIARAINGQTTTLLTETAQNIQLQADAPLLSATNEPAAEVSTITTTDNSSDQSKSDSNVEVIINGEKVPVPANGTVHREIRNENGQSSVNVSVDNGQVTTSSQTTSGSVNSYTHSYSSTQQTINGFPQ